MPPVEKEQVIPEKEKPMGSKSPLTPPGPVLQQVH
jgi:hypothetical protein